MSNVVLYVGKTLYLLLKKVLTLFSYMYTCLRYIDIPLKISGRTAFVWHTFNFREMLARHYGGTLHKQHKDSVY